MDFLQAIISGKGIAGLKKIEVNAKTKEDTAHTEGGGGMKSVLAKRREAISGEGSLSQMIPFDKDDQYDSESFSETE